MKVVHLEDANRVTPTQVVLVCILAATLAGVCLLTSGPHSEVLHDGAVAWGPNSTLRALVEVLNLRFSHTTARGVEIKTFAFGIGLALALVTLGIAGAVSARGATQGDVETHDAPSAADDDDDSITIHKKQIPKVFAAQLLLGAYAVWSLASTLWSHAPEYAWGGGVLVCMHVAWAIVLGVGLNRRTASVGAVVLIAVSCATAVLAVWYHQSRNPGLRASYPIGNPLFLAAVLIPALLLTGAAAIAKGRSAVAAGDVKSGLRAVISLAAFAAIGMAVYLADSRAGLVALLGGVTALAWLGLGRRARWAVGGAMIIVCAGLLASFFFQRDAYSPTGRSQTIRARMYAWNYAFDLAVDSPLIGQGEGGFVLRGDEAAAGDDVLNDPLALDARVSHAHNEWLEIWCDLGSVGLVLILAALGLTLAAASQSLGDWSIRDDRWLLMGLSASLVALMVESLFDVGLRHPGLPAIFFTLIGLIWAMSKPVKRAEFSPLPQSAMTRWIIAAAAIVGAYAVARQVDDDLSAGRSYYEVPNALASLQYNEGIQMAEHARAGMLSPQRKLEAEQRLCAAYLQSARQLMTDVNRLLSDPGDDSQRRRALAAAKRAQAVDLVRQGQLELGSLLKAAPAAWGSGMIEHGFYVILAEMARLDGDAEGVEANIAASLSALERELRRQPFDPGVALTFASTAGPRVDIATLFDVLARPIRHARTPAEYVELLLRLSETEGFDDAYAPVFTLAAETTPDLPVESWPSAWAPEILRMGTAILFQRGLYDRAAGVLEQAAGLYAVLGDASPMGAASCLAELADARFFATPNEPQHAIEAAGRAVERAPDSEPGRQLVQDILTRTVSYKLAMGDEAAAGVLLKDLNIAGADDEIQQAIGARYSRLAHSFTQRQPEQIPRRVATWIERALTLNPDYERGWTPEESIRTLSWALQLGADVRIIERFVEETLALRPDDEAFQALQQELQAVQSPADIADGPPANEADLDDDAGINR